MRGSKKANEELGLKPTDFLVGLPQLAGFVNVNLAGLLGICLAKLLANPQGVDAGLEDASLAAKVGGAREAERCGKVDFSLVQHVPIKIVG